MVDRWKATELLQFMLYAGKQISKGVLDEDLYQHFVVFSVTMNILVCPDMVKDYAGYTARTLAVFCAQSKDSLWI